MTTQPDATPQTTAYVIADALRRGATRADAMTAGREHLAPWWRDHVYPPIRTYIEAETGLSARSRAFAGKATSRLVEVVQPAVLFTGLLNATLALRVVELTGESLEDVLDDATARADAHD